MKDMISREFCGPESFSVSFSSSQAIDWTVLCQEPPWRSSTKFAWGARILSFPILPPPHMCPWCQVSWCSITKCLAPCLPHPLSPSPSSTTPEGNLGSFSQYHYQHMFFFILNLDGLVHLLYWFFFLLLYVWFWFSYSLVWTVAKDSAFSVNPSSCDLAPLKSTSFRVTYDPKQLNTLHGAQLECFGCYKMVYIKSPLQYKLSYCMSILS